MTIENPGKQARGGQAERETSRTHDGVGREKTQDERNGA